MRKSTWKRIKQEREKALFRKLAESAPGGKRGTAYHEASHAVVAELFSFPIDHVSIEIRKGVSQAKDVTATLNGLSGQRGVAISIGHCQHVLTNGVVPLSSSFRTFCYSLGEMASIPAEKKLGIPLILASVIGDIQKIDSYMDASPEFKLMLMQMI